MVGRCASRALAAGVPYSYYIYFVAECTSILAQLLWSFSERYHIYISVYLPESIALKRSKASVVREFFMLKLLSAVFYLRFNATGQCPSLKATQYTLPHVISHFSYPKVRWPLEHFTETWTYPKFHALSAKCIFKLSTNEFSSHSG